MTSAESMLIAAHPVVNETPFPPFMFGVIAFLVALGLLGLLWAFRNTLALDPHGMTEGEHDPDSSRGSSAH